MARFKDSTYFKILILILVLTLLPLNELSVFGGIGGNTGSSSGSSGITGASIHTNSWGMKVSVLVTPNKGDYDSGILMEYFPNSALGMYDASPVKDGTYTGVMPLYFLYGNVISNPSEIYYADRGSETIWDYDMLDANVSNRSASELGLSSEPIEYNGTVSKYTEASAFEALKVAYNVNWWNTSTNNIESILGIPANDEEGTPQQQADKHAILMTLTKIMGSVHGDSGWSSVYNLIKDGEINSGDIVFIMEPQVCINIGGSRAYISIRNYEGIINQERFDPFIFESVDSQYIGERGASITQGWDWNYNLRGALLGINSNRKFDYKFDGSYSIASKIYYTGRTGEKNADGTDKIATMESKRLGFGAWMMDTGVSDKGANISHIGNIILNNPNISSENAGGYRLYLDGNSYVKALNEAKGQKTEFNIKGIVKALSPTFNVENHIKGLSNSYNVDVNSTEYIIDKADMADEYSLLEVSGLEDGWVQVDSGVLMETRQYSYASSQKESLASLGIPAIIPNDLKNPTTINETVSRTDLLQDSSGKMLATVNSKGTVGDMIEQDLADRNISKTVFTGTYIVNLPDEGLPMLQNSYEVVTDALVKRMRNEIESSGGGTVSINGRNILEVKSDSSYLHGEPTGSRTSTNFSHYEFNDSEILRLVEDSLKPSSPVANEIVYNGNVEEALSEQPFMHETGITIADTGVLSSLYNVESGRSEEEHEAWRSTTGLLGESLMAAQLRSLLSSSFKSLTYEGLTDAEKIEFENRLGYAFHYAIRYKGATTIGLNIMDSQVPVNLNIVTRDGNKAVLEKVLVSTFYTDAYEGLTIDINSLNEYLSGYEIEKLAVKGVDNFSSLADDNILKFIEDFNQTILTGGSAIAYGDRRARIVNFSDTDEIKLSASKDDIEKYSQNTEKGQINIVLFCEPTEPELTVIKVFDTIKEGIITNTLTTKEIPSPIPDTYNIEDESGYSVVEWFTVLDKEPYPIEPDTPWVDIVIENPKDEQGTDETEINIKVPEDAGKEVIYIHYERDGSDLESDGDLILTEKRISKKYTLSDITPLLQGNSNVQGYFSGECCICEDCGCDDGDSSCTCSHGWGYWEIANWFLVYQNMMGVTDPKTVAFPDRNVKGSENFGIRYSDNERTGNMDGESKSGLSLSGADSDEGVQPKPELEFVVFRGYGLPTLAEYAYKIDNRVGLNGHDEVLSELGIQMKNEPNSLEVIGSYTRPVVFNLDIYGDNSSYSFIGICSNEQHSHSFTETFTQLNYNLNLLVEKHMDLANKGQEKSSVLGLNSTTINGKTINHLQEAVVNATDTEDLKFYPYIEQVYDTLDRLADEEDMRVNTLADSLSIFKPNDYLEYGWFNADESNSLIISSTQWTTHARATTGSEWRIKNRVLPGGAIFQASHNESSRTTVGVKSWQTYVDQNTRDAVGTSGVYSTFDLYKYGDKKLHHENIVESLKQNLETLHMMMWANTSWSSSPYDGQKVFAGSTFNNKTLQMNDKYWFRKDNTGLTNDNVGGDADVIPNSEKTKITWYRMRAEVNGDIFVDRYISENGDTTPNTNSWTAIQSWDKNQTSVPVLSGELEELDKRTKLISNFFMALDRNQGNDTSLVGTSEGDTGSPEWYNESFRGIGVCVTETIFDIGFVYTPQRTAVLDPYLEPPHADKNSILTNAFVLGVRMEEKQIPIEFGTLSGKNTTFMKDVQDTLRSKPFYVPNASVTDLQN